MASIIVLTVLLTLGASSANEVRSDPAAITDYPWMVLMGNWSGTAWQHCQGVIIAPRYVLTTGDCALDAHKKNWTIQSGRGFSPKGTTKHKSVERIAHPNATKSNGPNIAILRVEPPFDFDSETIHPIVLPGTKFKIDSSKDAYLVGFDGLTPADKPPTRLRKIKVKIHDEAECSQLTNILKGVFPRGTCIYRNDSDCKLIELKARGVPLVDGNKTLVGFGAGKLYDEKIKYRAAFSIDIAPHTRWIKKVIDEKSGVQPIGPAVNFSPGWGC